MTETRAVENLCRTPAASRAANWRAVTTLALACVPSTLAARGSSANVPPSLPLETLSFADAERAGAVGTGCTWRLAGDRAGRLAMADDRAAVRRDGSVVALRPAPDTRPLFLTYDRWIGEGVRLRVRDSGNIVRRGRESSVTAASVELTVGSRVRTWKGLLDCGS